MHIEHHYNWRYQDHLGKWRTTRHLCSEEMIKKEHPEATPAKGTLTVIEEANARIKHIAKLSAQAVDR
ncbi:hypothetical protein [Comamonas testosteroni]|uniref:hypothetical protein n=1 Tax=Comamonas testosteroni TaxID=285 RepID=UPI00265FD59C|nr:hypothetical protein [Comamonas testosteroni]WKL15481.1 hypothetical protein QYQ99_24575 [Comamonas testosteroni]